ncbi:MAG: UDP-N-acetyl-D-glucosamine dehydrogenase [Desulfovibrio sp.]|nr:UDP-N-acetyl-D-glucosamine dehydrogenase [Desulfovibrio sp.]
MSRPDTVKVAVVGVGYLGRFHAEKLARIKGAELVAVVDSDPERARAIARDLGVKALTDHRELIGLADAASVVTPTVAHHQVAMDLLQGGLDLLCEKPITATLEQADQLIALAAERGRILQVGHLERFNPAVEDLEGRVKAPLFIECNRIAPFKARATDVDVALDLMIHDLDIILALVGEEPRHISAVGVPVLGPHADIVNARLEFPSGCVANITASRLALKDERKMRIFQPDAYLSLDFKKRKLLVVSGVEYRPGKIPKVDAARPRFGKGDPLEEELKSFLESVRTRRPPRVSGVDGRRALACALAVRDKVHERLAGREAVLEEPRRWVDAQLPEAR